MSVIFVIAGCLLVILPKSTPVQVVGFFLIFAGLILFMVLRSGYKQTATGEIYKKKEKYYAQSMKDSVLKAINTDPDTIKTEEEDKGNGLRIDTYYSTKTGKACCRVYEYIPYTYEPCSPYIEYPIEKVEKLIK